MTRLSQTLMLLTALAALTLAALTATNLAPREVLPLVVGGVLAHGFSRWQPAEPAIRGLYPSSRIAQAFKWLLRALLGSAVLGLMLWAALWALTRV
jgi:hypothetical protein